MALKRKDYRELLCDTSTLSGFTYYIEDRPVCARPKMTDPTELCMMEAGQRTDHLGEGPCYLHGGNARNGIAQIRNGRYGGVVYRDLKRKYEQFIIDPDFLDITPELALARSVLAQDLKKYAREEVSSVKIMGHIKDIVGIVERIERIQSQQALTVTTVRLMMARGLEVARLFVPPEQLVEFVEAWRDEPTVKLSTFLPASIEVDE